MSATSARRGITRRALITAIGLVLIVAACAAVVFFFRGGQQAPVRSYGLVNPRVDTLIATVNATGQIAPVQTVNLSFAVTGRVAEVLVRPGDTVEKGQPLARLDTRELELRLAQAEAQLAQAQANLDRLLAGPSPAEIAAAEAQLAQAAGQLRQVEGSVTTADMRAAEEQLRQAEARLNQLLNGPRESDVQTAEARIREAELNLERQRAQLSAAKTNAQIQLEQAVNQLTQAQSRYSTAKQNWEYVRETGADPIVRTVADPNRPGQTRPNILNDSQRQQYYDAFVQAEATLRSAENAVAQAQVNYDNARQAEANGVELAEGQVAVARANRDLLFATPEPDVLAAARAQVASARAALDRMRGDQRGGQLEAARAAYEAARANLERLRADPRSADLAASRAQVDGARAARDLARLTLDEAVLKAPFSGVVAEVNLKVGEAPSPGRPAIVLANLERFYVDVTVDEIDITRVSVGQPVTLTLDALPEVTLAATVETIGPLALPQAAVTSYQVRIGIPNTDPRVRAGMSVGADIVVAERDNALLVPRRAVRSDRGRLIVDVVRDPGLCAAPPEQRPARPDLESREVTVGLSNDQAIEILSGLDPQACVYVEGVDQRFTFFTGPPRTR